MESKTSPVKKERNAGIDLLRIVSMFFVVVLHTLGQGGILFNTAVGSSQYKVAWLLEIFACGAVDIFALISGYVSYTGKEKRVNFGNYFSLWLQTVFYGVIIVTVFYFALPGKVMPGDYKYAVLPVTKNTYWYFRAYTGVFMLMPLLNASVVHMRETALRKLVCVIILAASVFSVFCDAFSTNGGYSFAWILLLYILGAAIKKCGIGERVKPYQAGLGILLLGLFTFLYKLHGKQIFMINQDSFISYTSPTVLGMAILFVVAFPKIRFSNGAKKIIGFAAPGAFAVYLLNTQPLFFTYVMQDLFRPLAEQSPLKIIVFVIGFSLLFVIGSLLVDRVRMKLFEICKVKAIGDLIGRGINRLLTKAAGWIS